PGTHRVSVPLFLRARRSRVIRVRSHRGIPAHGVLCRPYPSGSKTRRAAGAETDAGRAGDQSQDRKDAWARGAAGAVGAGGRGHSMSEAAITPVAERGRKAAAKKIGGQLFRKYVALFLAVICIALLANGLLETWFFSREHKSSLI